MTLWKKLKKPLHALLSKSFQHFKSVYSAKESVLNEIKRKRKNRFYWSKGFWLFWFNLMFSRDSEYCQRCPAFEACEQKSYETLNAIKQVVNVNDLLKQHEKLGWRKKLNAELYVKKWMLPKVFLRVGSTKETDSRWTSNQGRESLFEPTPEQQELIVKLPVKAQSFALTLVKSGLVTEIKEGLAKTKMPWKEKLQLGSVLPSKSFFWVDIRAVN